MSIKIYNAARSKSLSLVTDASGATYLLKPNGKKHYYLTVAITANSTTVTSTVTAANSAAGDTAETSHATGRASMFVSDGTKWQYLTNA